MNWIKKLFPPFRLPEQGDKVIAKGDKGKNRRVYEVRYSSGTKKRHEVYLTCCTYFKEGEWELVDKNTPTRY